MIAKDTFTEEYVKALFTLAGFKTSKIYELKNQYFGRDNVNAPSWYLMKTEHGHILIGPRARVMNIDWSDTQFRKIITEDDVTKSTDYVHAWGIEKTIEYLSSLKQEMVKFNV